MSDHIRVDESYVNALLGHAAWDKAEVQISESASKQEEVIEEAEEVPFCPLCESCLEEEVSEELYEEFLCALEEAMSITEEAPATKKELASAEGEHRKAERATNNAQTPDEKAAQKAKNKEIEDAMGKAKVGHPDGVPGIEKELKDAAGARAAKASADLENSTKLKDGEG